MERSNSSYPGEIYSRPATAYTAEFIGQTNLLRCEVTTTCPLRPFQWKTSQPNGAASFSVRPEAIHSPKLASLT